MHLKSDLENPKVVMLKAYFSGDNIKIMENHASYSLFNASSFNDATARCTPPGNKLIGYKRIFFLGLYSYCVQDDPSER